MSVLALQILGAGFQDRSEGPDEGGLLFVGTDRDSEHLI